MGNVFMNCVTPTAYLVLPVKNNNCNWPLNSHHTGTDQASAGSSGLLQVQIL